MRRLDALKGTALGRLLSDVSLVALDVGARGGFVDDLLPIAPAVHGYGFEPDDEECTRLNARVAEAHAPWRSLTYLPVALSNTNGEQVLHLYRRRSCSSLLRADANQAKRFSRSDWFHLDGCTTVETMTLESACSRYGVPDPAYMKLDIQGAEGVVLGGASSLLARSLVMLRVEVGFVRLYEKQELFVQITQQLERFGLFPAFFVEMHEWRQYTQQRHVDYSESGPFYSRGRLAHGDVIYLREWNHAGAADDVGVEKLIGAALLALCYDAIDYAYAIMARSVVRSYVMERHGFDPALAVLEYSRLRAAWWWRGGPLVYRAFRRLRSRLENAR